MITNKTALDYEIRIPEVISKYKVLEYINCGSFSVCYKVLDLGTHQYYCAKVASIEDMTIQGTLDSMKDEISILQMINHPNVVKCYDSFTIKNSDDDDELFVIITEFCSCGNLYDYIYEHQDDMSTEDVKFFIKSIIEAVLHIHSIGIAHCDIKPNNILLDDQLNPKLCDFNLSKKVKYTKDMTCGGTFPYMAPEISEGKPVDFIKADIYSLGITIYEIAECCLPFCEDSEGNLFLSISTRDDELKDLVEKCTRYEPKTRVSTVFLIDEPFFYGCEDNYCDYNCNYNAHRNYYFEDEYDTFDTDEIQYNKNIKGNHKKNQKF